MAYLTWRENEEMRQGERDYSSCALNAAGTECGGSATSPEPSFFVFPLAGGWAHLAPDGSWQPGQAPLYNYAPINHYQRPEERWTFGGALSYEFGPAFAPYLETMFTNYETSVQIAESGTFFVNTLMLTCDDPIVGTMCSDLDIAPEDEFGVLVGKRNNEGGPRISDIETSSYRFVTGTRGEINPSWTYDVSFMRGRTTSNESNRNDFLIDRLEDNGWVRREPDPQDRRVKRIYPTAEAERRQKVMWQIAEETVADALGDLTPEQRDLVCDLLLSVKSRLQRMVQDSMPNGADIRANGDGRRVDAPRQSQARTS
jgi:hypothetical protein